mgnify:CR=1 FL=1
MLPRLFSVLAPPKAHTKRLRALLSAKLAVDLCSAGSLGSSIPGPGRDNEAPGWEGLGVSSYAISATSLEEVGAKTLLQAVVYIPWDRNSMEQR